MAEGAAQKGGALSSDAPSVRVADEAWKVSTRKCGERGRLCFRQGRYALGRDRCGRGEPDKDRGAAAPACDDENHCALGGPGGGSRVVGGSRLDLGNDALQYVRGFLERLSLGVGQRDVDDALDPVAVDDGRQAEADAL